VISLNLQRRHLKAMIAARMMPMFEDESYETNVLESHIEQR